MSTVKLQYFIFGIFLQILINNANGKPICPGEYESCNYECGPAPAIIPIPQPVPVRIPQRERCPPSVTIPNIIVALLPPNNKPCVPRPVIRPPPVVLPLPRPSFPSFPGYGGYGGGFGSGCGGFGGGFGGFGGGFGGCGC